MDAVVPDSLFFTHSSRRYNDLVLVRVLSQRAIYVLRLCSLASFSLVC